MFKYKNLIRVFSWVLVFFWMVLIFNLSSQAAEQSNELSKGIAEVIVEVVEKVAPEKTVRMDVKKLNHLIRKKSHFFVFLVLGTLFMDVVKRNKVYGTKGIIIALLFCSFYAISDEVHQMFVPGRGAQIQDVFIDIAGAAAGILGYLSIGKL